MLSRTPHPTGTDGYYYVVQVVDLVAHGRLHVPDASWVLPALALPHALGLDPTTSIKLVSCLLVAATVPAAARFGRSPGVAAGLAAWAAASPTLTQLAADFPKNLGAVPLLMAAIAFARAGGRGWQAALVLLVVAAGAHRTGAALALAMAIGALGGAIAGRASPRAVLLAGGAFAVAAVSFGLASVALPSLLHPDDLHRLDGQLRATPWPPPPWSFTLAPWHPVQTAELALCWLGLAAAARAGVDPVRRPLVGALALPLGVCLFPWWASDGLDLGYRLSLLAPLFAAPLVALAVDGTPIRVGKGAALAPIVPLPLMALGFDPDTLPPYDRFDAVIAAVPRPLPPLVVAPQGINFLYDHRTGGEAMAWAPDPGTDLAGVHRIAWGVRDGEWLVYGPTSSDAAPQPVRLDAEYVWVREDVWVSVVASARAAGDDEALERMLDAHNPSRARPPSLLRGR